MGEHVVAGARVRVDGLKARPELNGHLGTLTSLNEETGRWNIVIDGMREPLALRMEALTIDEEFAGLIVGTRVRLADIDKRPELNGKLGTVEGFQGERCQVYVEAIRETLALKRSTLAVADDAPSSRDAATTEGGDVTAVRVECDGVILKLTLTEKQLDKPFAEAILRPFLRAFGKKRGMSEAEVDVKRVARVTVDSDAHTELQEVKEIHIFSAAHVLKGCRGDIDIEIYLKRDLPPPPPPTAKPKATDRLPKDARVCVHGLMSEAGQKLNGEEGRLSGFDEAKGRYDVTLQDGRVISAKPENLIDLG